jgi:hypothetical protein
MIHLHEHKLDYYRGGYDTFRLLFRARQVCDEQQNVDVC